MLSLALIPLVAIVWFRVNRLLYRDGFSPLNILLFSWIIPLLLRTANLSDLEQRWSTTAVVAVLWTTAALVLTCLVLAPHIRRGGAFEAHRADFAQALAMARSRSFAVVILGCFAVAFAAYLYSEFVTNPVGVPLLHVLRGGALEGDVHRWGKETRWSIVSPMLFFLSPLCFLAARGARSVAARIGWMTAAVLYPAFGVLKLSRSDVYIATLGIVAMAHYCRRFTAPTDRASVMRMARYGVLFAASLGLYYLLMAVRIGGATVGGLYSEFIAFRLAGDTPATQMLAAVYGYAALPFENFARFVDMGVGDAQPGIGVLRPFMAISGQGAFADRLDAMVSYPEPVSPAAGSATFLTTVYAEFGLAGVAVAPVVYGLLVNLIYWRMRLRPTPITVLLYLNFIYPWTWLYFNNAFQVLTIYLNAALIALVGLVVAELRRRAAWGAHSGAVA